MMYNYDVYFFEINKKVYKQMLSYLKSGLNLNISLMRPLGEDESYFQFGERMLRARELS